MVGDRTCNTAQRRNANAVNLDETNVGGTAPEHELGIPTANRVDVCGTVVVHENADALPVDDDRAWAADNNPNRWVTGFQLEAPLPRHDKILAPEGDTVHSSPGESVWWATYDGLSMIYGDQELWPPQVPRAFADFDGNGLVEVPYFVPTGTWLRYRVLPLPPLYETLRPPLLLIADPSWRLH